MMHLLNAYQLTEFICGAFIIWVAFYLVSRDASSKLSWITTLFLFGMGFTLFTDPILQQTQTLATYVHWQKITDWPLFLSPMLYLHASIIASENKKLWTKYAIFTGYVLAFAFIVIDINGGLILRESVARYADFRRTDGFAPGILFIPSTGTVLLCFILGARGFYSKIGDGLRKYLLPTIAGLTLSIAVILIMISFYIHTPQDNTIYIYGFGTVFGTFLFIFSMVRYHLFSPAERIIFDRLFYYKTLLILVLILFYLGVIAYANIGNGLPTLVLITFVMMAVFISHSLYDWFGTFINDIIFNISSGLSVVNDNEIYEAIKNYNDPEKLENSSLLRLNIIKKKVDRGLLPIDALKELIAETVEYFKPKENEYQRIKSYLKYHLLKMIVIHEAEEGQILWELGFEEYPVRIMSREGETREPLFKIKSPADYTYTSRNAFLALKREAVHDITWRISYLEKVSKRRIIK